jgi:hypothetical protein
MIAIALPRLRTKRGKVILAKNTSVRTATHEKSHGERIDTRWWPEKAEPLYYDPDADA